jgi:aspartyl-tRNA(Asn)/glutamyl-tRNA(Gln) amidotransferase subunit A
VRGTPVNPHGGGDGGGGAGGPHRLPGGSSSGSGVATAAGLAAFAIGSDTGEPGVSTLESVYIG